MRIEAGHEVKIKRIKKDETPYSALVGQFVAACICGWHGRYQQLHVEAQVDCARHLQQVSEPNT